MTENLLLAQQKKLLITSLVMDSPGRCPKVQTHPHTQLEGASGGELGNCVDGSLLHGWREGPSATFRKAEPDVLLRRHGGFLVGWASLVAATH